MRRVFLLCLSTLAVACDGPTRSPVQPVLSPSPAPSPAPAPPRVVARVIEVGQTIEVPYLGWDDRETPFRLTAPVSGILVVRMSWRVSEWDIGWYSLTYGNRTVSGDFEIMVRVGVVAGQSFEFTVNNTWPWDPDPGFALTTWIE